MNNKKDFLLYIYMHFLMLKIIKFIFYIFHINLFSVLNLIFIIKYNLKTFLFDFELKI